MAAAAVGSVRIIRGLMRERAARERSVRAASVTSSFRSNFSYDERERKTTSGMTDMYRIRSPVPESTSSTLIRTRQCPIRGKKMRETAELLATRPRDRSSATRLRWRLEISALGEKERTEGGSETDDGAASSKNQSNNRNIFPLHKNSL
ncbi:hypothetical protein PUN28_017689 [Cardiocondyla obscurior]|uniref:Uncharacterized protein n=1 Tax=Cardiocondyla obscurior TaxID=286306 RepID=A0AAW2EKT0_9HYME